MAERSLQEEEPQGAVVEENPRKRDPAFKHIGHLDGCLSQELCAYLRSMVAPDRGDSHRQHVWKKTQQDRVQGWNAAPTRAVDRDGLPMNSVVNGLDPLAVAPAKQVAHVQDDKQNNPTFLSGVMNSSTVGVMGGASAGVW